MLQFCETGLKGEGRSSVDAGAPVPQSQRGMGVYIRPDPPFFWMLLERPRLKAVRESTGIPRTASTAVKRKANEHLAIECYNTRMTELARNRYQLPTPKVARSVPRALAWYASTCGWPRAAS